MTRPSGAHLSPDEIEACVSGAATPAAQQHLDACPSCLEQVRLDREIAELISGLPPLTPSPDFSQQVMAQVIIPDPFAIRSLQATRRRFFATPRSLATAATLILALVGSMVGSVVWSLANQDTLAAIGNWIVAQGGQAIWLGVQGVASTLIEQPWYAGFRSLVENPLRLAALSAAGSLAYLGGLLALRRLLAVPTQRVAHAGL
jgi:hypothetical protein